MTKRETDLCHSILIRIPKRTVLFIVFVLLLPEHSLSNAQRSTQPQPDNSYFPDNHIDPSISIIVVVLVCGFFFSILTVFLRYCSHLDDDVPDSTGGLDPTVIQTFPVFLYAAVKDLKIGKGTLECAICLSEFDDGDALRLIPKCDHVFHPECIGAWLASHMTCPVCRAKLSTESTKFAGDENGTAGLDQINSIPVAESGGVGNEVVVDVYEDASTRETQENYIAPKQNRLRETRVSGKFPRSHSTGHSPLHLVENTERYTLRVPEEVRKQLTVRGELKRARSYDGALAREGSPKKGGGNGSSRGKRSSGRWVFSMTPPFVSRGAGVRSEGEGDWERGVTGRGC